MYPAGATGAQAAPQAQAGPTASPAYSSYQPTPTAGYQVYRKASSLLPGPAPAPAPSPTAPLPSAERGLPGPAEPPDHLSASAVQHHGLHGEPVGLHGLPALQHAGTAASRLCWGWGGGAVDDAEGPLVRLAGTGWAPLLLLLALHSLGAPCGHLWIAASQKHPCLPGHRAAFSHLASSRDRIS